ncbi:MAG: flippase-like domain-containing protein [Candidatus Nomurabacteria bacterium]|nr:MAG: flippase-like domain-containing protein [Candidatus Nomurabacteria bacterium]
MKKELFKSLVSTTVVLLFVCIAIWYVVANHDDFAKIAITDPLYLVPALLFLTINIYGAGVVIDLATEPHGIKLKRQEAFGLAAITRFTNQLSPSYISATVRATYLKKTYGVSYTKFSSSFIISNLLQFMISGVFAIVTFFALEKLSTYNDSALITVGVVVIFFLSLLNLPVSRLRHLIEKEGAKNNRLLERLRELLDGYETVRSHPKLLPRTVLWMLVNITALGATYFFLYASLGSHLNVVNVFFISSLTTWSVLFAITPGSLGVREGLMVLAAQIAGVPIAPTLVVAILLRLLTFILAGVLSSYYTPKLLHTSIFKLSSKS